MKSSITNIGAPISEAKSPLRKKNLLKFFLSIEAGVQSSRLIKEIRDDKDDTITDPFEISEVFKKFYSKLYSYQSTDIDVQESYLGYTRKLSDEQREIIDQPITICDLRKALFDMREGASPGPNGLTVKFFKTFFDDISPLFMKSLEAAF